MWLLHRGSKLPYITAYKTSKKTAAAQRQPVATGKAPRQGRPVYILASLRLNVRDECLFRIRAWATKSRLKTLYGSSQLGIRSTPCAMPESFMIMQASLYLILLL